VAKSVDILKVSDQLESLHERALELEARYADELALVHPALRNGAKNLIHYLALRQSDIRALQEDLATLGLSSLGRAERGVMASIHAVQNAMSRSPETGDRDELVLRDTKIDEQREAILGRCPDKRNTNIMVTLPTRMQKFRFRVPNFHGSGRSQNSHWRP